jgi:hypothetical protein
LRFLVFGAASRKASTMAATWVSEAGGLGGFAWAKDGKNPKPIIIVLNINAIGFFFMTQFLIQNIKI